MTNPFAAAALAAASASPMASGSVPILPNRVLLVDGDGLAYYCAGNDDTDAGEARAKLVDKIKSAVRIVGAGQIKILLTGSGSHKGHRYAIARVKPYQAQRGDSRRPKNWQVLRDYMLSDGFPFDIEVTYSAEADDLFGWWAYNYPDDVVIYTQDKDMRMLPGKHLDWVSHRVHTVEYTLSTQRERDRMYNVVPTDSEFNDKQYGHKWFWLQMLHGDTADHIPGLPRYLTLDGKIKPVGEITAGRLLCAAPVDDIAQRVADLYWSYYGERYLVEMLEQACLLWMRRVPTAWDDCCQPGGPMAIFTDRPEFLAAYAEIQQRVDNADNINAQAQSQ